MISKAILNKDQLEYLQRYGPAVVLSRIEETTDGFSVDIKTTEDLMYRFHVEQKIEFNWSENISPIKKDVYQFLRKNFAAAWSVGEISSKTGHLHYRVQTALKILRAEKLVVTKVYKDIPYWRAVK